MSKPHRTPPSVAEMSDLHLLSYLLTLAGDREDTARDTAHSLLNTYDTLAAIISLPRPTLLSDPRLDEGSAAFLALVGAMSFRYSSRFRRSDLAVMDKETVCRLLAPHLQGHDVERVCAICVDQDFYLLGSSAIVTHGEANSVALPIQPLLNLALSSGAYGVILAHSHPDGSAQFSQTDLRTTDALRAKLALLGISLLDHYIWVPGGAISLYEQLHAATPPPPLDRWDIASMPLLSRLDPKTLPVRVRKRRKRKEPFFIEDPTRWYPIQP